MAAPSGCDEVPRQQAKTGVYAERRRGRWTSWPEQFGQTWFIASVQARQKVHSYEQM
jgi:hypothetical protein